MSYRKFWIYQVHPVDQVKIYGMTNTCTENVLLNAVILNFKNNHYLISFNIILQDNYCNLLQSY